MMKYFIGFIVGVILTALIAWKATDMLLMDGSIQSSFNSLIIYSAIENGLNEGKVESVRELVSKVTDHEINYIKDNKNFAWHPRTKEMVDDVITKSSENR